MLGLCAWDMRVCGGQVVPPTRMAFALHPRPQTVFYHPTLLRLVRLPLFVIHISFLVTLHEIPPRVKKTWVTPCNTEPEKNAEQLGECIYASYVRCTGHTRTCTYVCVCICNAPIGFEEWWKQKLVFILLMCYGLYYNSKLYHNLCIMLPDAH